MTPPRPRSPLAAVPLPVWVVGTAVTIHLLFFWAVSDKHFLFKARYVPPAPTPNFGARETITVDPRTGETVTRRDFMVSTRLATPPPIQGTPTTAPSPVRR